MERLYKLINWEDYDEKKYTVIVDMLQKSVIMFIFDWNIDIFELKMIFSFTSHPGGNDGWPFTARFK